MFTNVSIIFQFYTTRINFLYGINNISYNILIYQLNMIWSYIFENTFLFFVLSSWIKRVSIYTWAYKLLQYLMQPQNVFFTKSDDNTWLHKTTPTNTWWLYFEFRIFNGLNEHNKDGMFGKTLISYW